MKDIEKTSHDRTRQSSMGSPTTQLSPGSSSFPSAYQLGGVVDYSSMTPEMYAQYAYMYNYMYMQQQMALSQGMHMQMYGNYNDQTVYQQGSTHVKSHSPKNDSSYNKLNDTVPKVDNAQHLLKQQRKSPKDNMNHQRYNPYSRPSSSSSLSPGISSYIKPHSIANQNTGSVVTSNGTKPHVLSSSSNVSKSTNANESPMDLSKKGEKLQFLSTLKSIIESKDRLSSEKNKNTKANSCTNESTKPVVLDLRKKSEVQSNDNTISDNESTTVDSALKSQQDKLGYITVLKELLEKGHSTTSTKILSPDVKVKNEINNYTSQGHSTDIKFDTNGKVKQEKTEASYDELDDLSVEQSLVLRNLKK